MQYIMLSQQGRPVNKFLESFLLNENEKSRPLFDGELMCIRYVAFVKKDLINCTASETTDGK